MYGWIELSGTRFRTDSIVSYYSVEDDIHVVVQGVPALILVDDATCEDLDSLLGMKPRSHTVVAKDDLDHRPAELDTDVLQANHKAFIEEMEKKGWIQWPEGSTYQVVALRQKLPWWKRIML